MGGQRTGHHQSPGRDGAVFVALILFLLLLPSPASAGVFLRNGSDISGNGAIGALLSDPGVHTGGPADFFYNTHCGACHVAMAFLTEYQAAHPSVQIRSYDLFNNSENRALFEARKQEYNRSYVAVPVVFIGDAGLEGEGAIRSGFDALAATSSGEKNATPAGRDSRGSGDGTVHRTVISIPLVLIAGVIDGINPCAAAVLIFLLIILMTIRERHRIIPVGIVFASAVFFFYFLAGTGIFSIHELTGFIATFTAGAGILAVATALLLIIDSSRFHRWTEAVIPLEGRERAGRLWRRMTIPVVFIAALLAGILELPCAGGIYITILDMIAFRVNTAQGLVYLILYNLAFIIPLLLLTLVVRVVRRPEREGEEDGRLPRSIRIFAGLLLLVFAFLILTGLL